MLTPVNPVNRILQIKFYMMLNFHCSPELRVAPSHRTGLAFHAAMLKHQVVKYDHADESDVSMRAVNRTLKVMLGVDFWWSDDDCVSIRCLFSEDRKQWWSKWGHLLSHSVSVRAANYTLKVLNVFNSCLRVFEMRDFSRIAFRYFVMFLSGNQHVSVSVLCVCFCVGVCVFV